MVFHGVLIHPAIEQHRAIHTDPGYAEAVSLHIFQKIITVLLCAGDRKAQFIFQLLHLHTGKVIVQNTHHDSQRA